LEARLPDLLPTRVDFRVDFDLLPRDTACLEDFAFVLVAAAAGRINEAKRQKIRRMRLVIIFPRTLSHGFVGIRFGWLQFPGCQAAAS
jgi:hypothetical protein